MADKHTIEFDGQTFELQTGPLNERLYMKFMAFMADYGPDAEVPWVLLEKLLQASISKEDWRRFDKWAEETDDFMVKSVKVLEARMAGPVEADAGHPTVQPSVSTDGLGSTPQKSESNFDARVWELAHGRIDHYHMLMEHRKANLARSA